MTKVKAATKTAVYQALSESTGLSKKQIGTVFDELSAYIKAQLGKKGPGVFTVPGLLIAGSAGGRHTGKGCGGEERAGEKQSPGHGSKPFCEE